MVRAVMLGWEFPPFISGGLGTACHGLTKAMNRLDVEVLFVLPKAAGGPVAGETAFPRRASSFGPRRTGAFGHVTFRAVPSRLTNPYATSAAPGTGLGRSQPATAESPVAEEADRGRSSLRVVGTGVGEGYDGDLIGKVEEYANRCTLLLRDESFDIVHAHDWMTYPAGMAIAAMSARPLVVHVHSTEFDRSGDRVSPAVYDIERRGMNSAARVLCVSELTKEIVVNRYGIPPEKVEVVYNGIEQNGAAPATSPVRPPEKTVLFLGRLTMQKGPEFFVRAAARVLERFDNVRFVVVGSGDMAPRVIEQVAAMRLGHKVLFAGFLRGPDVDRAFRMSDVYVMPSVSEPFGLTALEAIRCGVPVVISKTSGVAEVLRSSALKVDFWDVDTMADMIVAVLSRPGIAESLREHGAREIRRLTWDESAKRCLAVYHSCIEAACAGEG